MPTFERKNLLKGLSLAALGLAPASVSLGASCDSSFLTVGSALPSVFSGSDGGDGAIFPFASTSCA